MPFIFLPGGPGVDSRYFLGLIDVFDFPGNCYLVDLPGNGDHVVEKPNYDEWLNILPKSLKQFSNPILIGHSFGGMLGLLCKELQPQLKGFIILGSAPSYWAEEAVKYAKNFNVPDLTKPLTTFNQNPTQKTFDAALEAFMPYYYAPGFEKQYRKACQVPFPFEPAFWWLHKGRELKDYAHWIPKIPTLIINGTRDLMTPYYIFARDKRFHKPNIQIVAIDDAGHFPWIEKPERMKELIGTFCNRLPKL